MEKERKITAPDGCEIEKVEIVDGSAVITFKEKERKLPKSWDEFCETHPIKGRECHIDNSSGILNFREIGINRDPIFYRNVLPDRSTAEAVLSLCQLITLRNAYNGDWVPDWNDCNRKFIIGIYNNDISVWSTCSTASVLFFKTEELRDEFLRNFRPLIEKIKPLYGIKKGGEE